MSKIQKQSRRARLFFQSLFVLTPIAVCYYWLTVETSYDFLTSFGIIQVTHNVESYTQLPLTLTTRILAAIASLFLCSIIMYALKVLINLFRSYERNEIFTLDNVMRYQKLGYSLFYWVGASIVYGALMSVILSFNNPPGERMLAIGFEGLDFLTLVLGFIILIISWVMKEGYILADENDHTI
ncbi:DUF2975 domain-containing protein [Moritella sp. F3]|uniref:DUF2975 domain-containing protein n=1 Tax=Moritella sp. F3 TaxID=2718882 RepID=UPI0018E1C3D3|nr:DUF2975 domain-containing protein [Moritella sp. F3]GIC75308.1 hypothetical protein FMO001_00350 [Moritella sp. F1]GIC80453.1 hypothetical protein FMO003_07340 [Moritella sp. F3]